MSEKVRPATHEALEIPYLDLSDPASWTQANAKRIFNELGFKFRRSDLTLYQQFANTVLSGENLIREFSRILQIMGVPSLD